MEADSERTRTASMEMRILCLMLMPFGLLLLEGAAAAKFRYVRPSKADGKDLAAVPSVLRIFVEHHNTIKYGSALILVFCTGWLSLGAGLSMSSDIIAKIAMLTSILTLSVALSWRMFVPVRGSRAV